MVLFCIFSEVGHGGNKIPTGAWCCIRADEQFVPGSNRGTLWASPSDWERCADNMNLSTFRWGIGSFHRRSRISVLSQLWCNCMAHANIIITRRLHARKHLFDAVDRHEVGTCSGSWIGSWNHEETSAGREAESVSRCAAHHFQRHSEENKL